MRTLGLIFRTLFILVLVAVTIRVAMPQAETVWTSYETPADLLRIVLGLFVCIWLGAHLFLLHKDASFNRTWVYIGPLLVPLAVLCAVVIW
ncbi:MAG: hypothetical protein ACLP8B_07270 [Xanthobacteraceae bacterium]|jgi:hypothetical protein